MVKDDAYWNPLIPSIYGLLGYYNFKICLLLPKISQRGKLNCAQILFTQSDCLTLFCLRQHNLEFTLYCVPSKVGFCLLRRLYGKLVRNVQHPAEFEPPQRFIFQTWRLCCNRCNSSNRCNSCNSWLNARFVALPSFHYKSLNASPKYYTS